MNDMSLSIPSAAMGSSDRSCRTSATATPPHCRVWAALGLWLACVPAVAAEFVGIVHPRHHLTLSVAVPGIVARLAVEPGVRVEAQQPLLWLDDRQQALEEQRRKTVFDDLSELGATEERLKVVQPLAEEARRLIGSRGAISREDAARSELDFISTRGRLAQLQVQKERERLEHRLAESERLARVLLAPVSGVVIKVGIDVGEWARPGDALVELVDASVLHLRVNLPAALARKLREGRPMTVAFEPSMGLEPAAGSISFVAPAADAASGLVEVRVRFANPGGRIPPGIKGLVTLDPGDRR
jgi:RND family efflux transporter MFP subunit